MESKKAIHFIYFSQIFMSENKPYFLSLLTKQKEKLRISQDDVFVVAGYIGEQETEEISDEFTRYVYLPVVGSSFSPVICDLPVEHFDYFTITNGHFYLYNTPILEKIDRSDLDLSTSKPVTFNYEWLCLAGAWIPDTVAFYATYMSKFFELTQMFGQVPPLDVILYYCIENSIYVSESDGTAMNAIKSTMVDGITNFTKY